MRQRGEAQYRWISRESVPSLRAPLSRVPPQTTTSRFSPLETNEVSNLVQTIHQRPCWEVYTDDERYCLWSREGGVVSLSTPYFAVSRILAEGVIR